eukprot:TRINITY_DN5176_c0_g1_i5.p1 TRINITY_DN5176_c0_g1~~TRINITY_DN5176_c0_g1_i5.p1  ORF type:complete len:1705 (-),score=276.50 TRINITY_DN5176_c0_g1_i5:514-5628(-)
MNPNTPVRPLDQRPDRLTLFATPPETPVDNQIHTYLQQRKSTMANEDVQSYPISAFGPDDGGPASTQASTPTILATPTKPRQSVDSISSSEKLPRSRTPEKTDEKHQKPTIQPNVQARRPSTSFFSRIFGSSSGNLETPPKETAKLGGEYLSDTMSPYSITSARLAEAEQHKKIGTTDPQSKQTPIGWSETSYVESKNHPQASYQSVSKSSAIPTQPSASGNRLQNEPKEPHAEVGSFQTIVKRIKELTSTGDLTKDYWMPDDKCVKCYNCEAEFHIFRRRHHCRLCGQIFCSKCIIETNIQIQSPVHAQTVLSQQMICLICQNHFQRFSAQPKEGSPKAITNLQKQLGNTMQSVGSWLEGKSVSGKSHNTKKDFDLGSELEIVDSSSSSSDEEVIVDEEGGISDDVEGIFIYESSEGEHSDDGDDVKSDMNSSPLTVQNTQSHIGRHKSATERVSEYSPLQKSMDAINSEVAVGDPNVRNRTPRINQADYRSNRLSRTMSLQFDQNLIRSLLEVQGITDISSQTLTKATNISSLAPVQRILQQFDDHLIHILSRLTSHYGINARWIDTIISLSRNALENLKGIRDPRTTYDIFQYIKIKKIPGGAMGDSYSREGYIFTKNVAHKKMATSITCPKVMLLEGSIEYLHVENKLVSLHPIVQQEREFLKNMVGKIAKASPSLLLVQKAVSGVALDLLMQENISVVLNIKEKSFDRLVAYLDTAPTQSIDKFHEPCKSTCQQFHVETFKLDDGSKRNICVFGGSPTKPGTYVVLRGEDLETLSSVKIILQFAILAMYNSIHESAFLVDAGCHFTDGSLETILEMDPYPEIGSLKQAPARNHQSNPVWSMTPGVEYPLPSSDWIAAQDQSNLEANHPIIQMTPQERAESTTFKMSPVEKHLAIHDEFDAQNDTGSPHPQPILYPTVVLHNQHIHFLTSCCTTFNGVQCEEPTIVNVEFYQESDLALGEFLERSCFDPNRPCPRAECTEKVHAHIRSFIHHRVCVNVGVESFASNDQFDTIHIRSFCRACQVMTDWSPLSNEAWKLSFGKFLEMCFYSKNIYSRGVGCQHPYFRNYNMYFRLKNMIAVFHCEDITLLDIHVPDTYLTYTENALDLGYEMVVTQVSSIIDKVYSEISAKLCQLESQPLYPEQSRDIQELKKSHRQEHATFYRQLAKYKESKDTFQVNKLKRSLVVSVKTWNSTFHELVMRFSRKRVNHHASVVDDPNAPDTTFLSILSSSPGDMAVQAQDELYLFVHHNALSKERAPSTNLSCSVEYCKYLTNGNEGNDESTPKRDCLDLGTSPSEHLLDAKYQSTFGHPDDTHSQAESTTSHSSHRTSTNMSSRDGHADHRGHTIGSTVSKPAKATFLAETVSTVRSAMNYLGKSFDPNILLPENILGHVLLPPGTDDVVVEVFDDEPGSMIVYTLCSHEYRDKMSSYGCDIWYNVQDQTREEIVDITKNPNFPQYRMLDSMLLDKTPTHIRHKFMDDANGSKVQYICTAYYAKQFHALRQLHCGGEFRFLHSLSRCKKWGATGGKSGSTFCKTLDDRFVLKQVSKIELSHFLEFAPQYFEYMFLTHFKQLPSVMVKILGIYRVGHRQNIPGAPFHVQDFIVLENLFYNRKLKHIFDLKGSKRSRYVQAKGRDAVLMDENLMEYISMSPLYTFEATKNHLNMCIHNDTMFLSNQNVVDYSLLAGIDEDNGELVVGIIGE